MWGRSGQGESVWRCENATDAEGGAGGYSPLPKLFRYLYGRARFVVLFYRGADHSSEFAHIVKKKAPASLDRWGYLRPAY